jgi:hypothetical protein
MYVYCIYITTNSDFALHKINLFVFFNRDEKCLLRGTNLVFKWNSLRFVFKGLKDQSVTCLRIFCLNLEFEYFGLLVTGKPCNIVYICSKLCRFMCVFLWRLLLKMMFWLPRSLWNDTRYIAGRRKRSWMTSREIGEMKNVVNDN